MCFLYQTHKWINFSIHYLCSWFLIEKLIILHFRHLNHIEEMQGELNSYGAILKTLPLMERRQGDVSREYLAYMSMLLFNACKSSQVQQKNSVFLMFNKENVLFNCARYFIFQNALKEYCLNTREDMLFISIREMLQLSVLATKERYTNVSFSPKCSLAFVLKWAIYVHWFNCGNGSSALHLTLHFANW